MEVTREFDNFSDAFLLLNSLLKACDTPYRFPPCQNVKDFVVAYAEIQFSRSISSSGFSYIDFHLQVNEGMVKFDYVSTSGTSVSAEFDSGLWDDDRQQYNVTVELATHRCRKDGCHYNTLTKALSDDYRFEEGLLNHATGRLNNFSELKGLPTPEWVLQKRSNFILWNEEEEKLVSLLDRRGFLEDNSWICKRVFERKGYMVAYQKGGYLPTFTCCDPGETLAQGCVFDNLLDVLGWIDHIEAREQRFSNRQRFVEPDDEYKDYEDIDDLEYDV